MNGFEMSGKALLSVLPNVKREARKRRHDYVGSEHILLALLALKDHMAVKVLSALGVDRKQVRRKIENMIGTGDNAMLLGDIPFTPEAKSIMAWAVAEAMTMGSRRVFTMHLLLGILQEERCIAACALNNFGVTLAAVRKKISELT